VPGPDLDVAAHVLGGPRGQRATLTADLSAELIAVRPPRKTVPAQATPSANKALLWGSWVVVLLTIGFMLGALPASPEFALVVGILPLLIGVPVAGSLTLDAWREKRSHGQLPPRPARSSQRLDGERDSATGDDLIHCQAHRDTRAGRPLGHSVIQYIWRSGQARRASPGLCA
jgi:hypothetical protein